MTVDAARIARTEALFREVNEQIADVAARFASPEAEMVCECADATCTERLPVSLEEYERVRGRGDDFLIAPGHELPEVERVIARGPRHRVVRKVEGTVAALVRRLNPREAPA